MKDANDVSSLLQPAPIHHVLVEDGAAAVPKTKDFVCRHQYVMAGKPGLKPLAKIQASRVIALQSKRAELLADLLSKMPKKSENGSGSTGNSEDSTSDDSSDSSDEPNLGPRREFSASRAFLFLAGVARCRVPGIAQPPSRR